MSSLVLLGEQPSAAELADVLPRLVPAAAAAGLPALAKEPKTLHQLLEKGVFANQPALLALPEEDLSTVLSLSMAVLAQLTVAAEAASAVQKLSGLLTTEPTQRAAFKIRTLSNLINVVGGLATVAQAQRFQLLLQLLQFALAASTAAAGAPSSSAAASPASLVLQPLSTLSSLVDFWRLTPEQSLALYAASYQLASVVGGGQRKREAEGAPIVVYNLGKQPTSQDEYLYALLKAVDAAGASNPAVLKEKANQDYAVAAVVASVSNGLSSTIHQLDSTHLYPLSIVQSLSSSNSVGAAAAFALLKILVTADVAGLASFEKTHAAWLKEHAADVDSPTLLRKLRTLALCHLAVQNQSAAGSVDNILPYSAIREKLQLSKADEVEAVVIDAVMAGRLDAKMDQEAETLCVK